MFDKICFFHNHVNGDCFLSRILVKQIIDANKSKNITYYYTAPRALVSHCLDLGIPDKNFNIIPVQHLNELFFVIDNMLFINIWIAIFADLNDNTKNKICALCLNNVIPNYNKLIEYHKENELDLPQVYIELFAKHLDDGKPLKPSLPLTYGNISEDLG